MSANRAWLGCVFVGVSLDGYIAREDGSLDWLEDPTQRSHTAGGQPTALEWDTFYPTVDVIVMGRGTYDKVLTFGQWPYGNLPVLVLSTSLAPADVTGTVSLVDSVDAAVRKLNELGARRVYIDGGITIQAFLKAGLVDEITVTVAPVLIGQGISLFGDLDNDVELILKASHVTAQGGMVASTYEVVRTPLTVPTSG